MPREEFRDFLETARESEHELVEEQARHEQRRQERLQQQKRKQQPTEHRPTLAEIFRTMLSDQRKKSADREKVREAEALCGRMALILAQTVDPDVLVSPHWQMISINPTRTRERAAGLGIRTETVRISPRRVARAQASNVRRAIRGWDTHFADVESYSSTWEDSLDGQEHESSRFEYKTFALGSDGRLYSATSGFQPIDAVNGVTPSKIKPEAVGVESPHIMYADAFQAMANLAVLHGIEPDQLGY